MNRFTPWILALLAAPALLCGDALAGECAVTIRSPAEGDRVGGEVMAEGTAEVPAGAHVWVLVGINGMDAWFPQGNGAARIDGSEWQILAFVGQDRDIGRKFEIAAIVVDDAGHQRLESWFKESNDSGHYSPIKMPSTFAGCLPETVTVEKTSH
jgi:hypothetical protein